MSGPANQTNGQLDQLGQFEQKLAGAMRRVDPPASFESVLMERIAREERPSARVLAMPTRWRALQMWSAGAVAAALVLAVGVEHMHHRQERAEATRQFEVATQIEQQALDRTREKLSRSGITLGVE